MTKTSVASNLCVLIGLGFLVASYLNTNNISGLLLIALFFFLISSALENIESNFELEVKNRAIEQMSEMILDLQAELKRKGE